MAARECNASECGATIPLQMDYCAKHWQRIPVRIRRRIRAARGDEDAYDALVEEAQDVLDLGDL